MPTSVVKSMQKGQNWNGWFQLPDLRRTGSFWMSRLGGGHTALTFAPFVEKVIATDLTPAMLKTAEKFIREEKKITNVEFELADAENLPFEDSSFDLVTCRIAPHPFFKLSGICECKRPRIEEKRSVAGSGSCVA